MFSRGDHDKATVSNNNLRYSSRGLKSAPLSRNLHIIEQDEDEEHGRRGKMEDEVRGE